MKLHQITEGELSLLELLWLHGEATTRQLATALYEEVTDPKMATVQKLIERLEAKGCVLRDRSERAHRFRPLLSHEEFLRSRLQALADRLCDGGLVPLVTTLLRSKGITRREREQLRRLVEDLWPSQGAGSRTSK